MILIQIDLKLMIAFQKKSKNQKNLKRKNIRMIYNLKSSSNKNCSGKSKWKQKNKNLRSGKKKRKRKQKD